MSHASTSKMRDYIKKNYIFPNVAKLILFKSFSWLAKQISEKRKKINWLMNLNSRMLNYFKIIVLKGHEPDSFLTCPSSRVLVLQPGVRSEALRWESQVKDIGPPETSRPHLISIGGSSPWHLHLSVKTQLHSTTSKLQCWTPHAKQLARQEHSPTH